MALYPRIIGKRGPATFLVQTSANQAFVADLSGSVAVRYPALFIESLIARGGWERKANDRELLAVLLKLPPAPADPEPVASAEALRSKVHNRMLIRFQDRAAKAKAREERRGGG